MDYYIKRNEQVKNKQENLYVMYKFDMLKKLVDIKCIVDKFQKILQDRLK